MESVVASSLGSPQRVLTHVPPVRAHTEIKYFIFLDLQSLDELYKRIMCNSSLLLHVTLAKRPCLLHIL